jgi:phosphatidylglycerophosphatase A
MSNVAPSSSRTHIPVKVSTAIATWFGCGLFPWGPGTVGSLAAVAIAFVLHAYGGLGRGTLIVVTVVLLGPGIWAATQTAQLAGRKDPGLVVVDEVLGQWVALLGVAARNWKVFVVAFILFRVFDIWKPWPVRKLEQLPEGVGIVADDLAAGAYAALILYIGGLVNLY